MKTAMLGGGSKSTYQLPIKVGKRRSLEEKLTSTSVTFMENKQFSVQSVGAPEGNRERTGQMKCLKN